MTRQRYDNHSTEFGLWLRQQAQLDSKFGYQATNLDYIWGNYKTGDWMCIEEKRYGADVSLAQRQLFGRLNKAIKEADRCHGVHLLQFENTTPDDGRIYWNRVEITKDELMNLLKFKERI